MKNLLLFLLLVSTIITNAQVGIGTNTPDASAKLDITSSSQGLLVPRMTSSQRTSINSPATGLIVYQTDGTAGFYYNVGTAVSPNWVILLNGGSSISSSNITGTLPVANGGTGSTTISGIQTMLGLLSNNVAIGSQAGTTNQGVNANTIAIGAAAGNINQGNNAIAIGSISAQSNQATQAVAIGYAAGQYNQGQNSIAIGTGAGNIDQASHSIVLNAIGSYLNAANYGFFVGPIRSSTLNGTNLLTYNATTNEITFNSAKTFVINHPTKPDSYLVHACLEGPEAGVYYRGEAKIENNQSVTVKLPDYVSAFASNFSIQITPIYTEDSNDEVVYRTSRVKDNAFTVHGKNGSFYWIVYGQRGKVEVEPKKSEVQVGGDGPYKYIKSKK